MYQLLVEIHNQKQLLLIKRQKIVDLVESLKNLALLQGAKYLDLGQGKHLLTYQIHRPSDTFFLIESLFSIRDVLVNLRQELFGFSLLMESSSDDDESIRQLCSTLLTSKESECVWIGPNAFEILQKFLVIERAGKLYKAIGKREADQEDYDLVYQFFETSLQKSSIIPRLKAALGTARKGKNIVYFSSVEERSLGELVHQAIISILGTEEARDFFWILGQDQDDPVPVALTRALFPLNRDKIELHMSAEERLRWHECSHFLIQNASSTISGLQLSIIPPEYPLELFEQSFELFFLALLRQNKHHQNPLIVHIERKHLLSKQALDCLDRCVDSICKSNDQATFLLVYSGLEPEDIPDGISKLRSVEIKANNWFDLRLLGLDSKSLPQALATMAELEHVDARNASILRYLVGKSSQLQANADLSIALDIEGLSPFKINQSILRALLSVSDPVLSEVYYVIVLTFGFLNLRDFFDFLEVLKIEKIRHPGLVHMLKQLGLIRDEELLFPTFDQGIETIEAMLSDKAIEIRQALDIFLFERFKASRLPIRLDSFLLLSEIASPENFFEISFLFAQQLLNALNFETCSQVLNHMAVYQRNLKDGQVSQKMEAALGYFNARSLLLQADKNLARAHESLRLDETEATDIVHAYWNLQKSRYLFHCGKLDDAHTMVKKAVIKFQELNDKSGLSASQTLFGHILLSRERLLDAKDYFIIARNNASGAGAIFEDLWAGFSDLVVTFVHGYFSRVLNALSDPQGIYFGSQKHGFMRFVAYLDFIRARIYFELGQYQEACRSFQKLCTSFESFPIANAAETSRAWLARANVYAGEHSLAQEIFSTMQTRESLFFQAEQALLQDQADLALTKLASFESLPSKGKLYTPEGINWQDGFASLEDIGIMAGGAGDILSIHAQVYRGLALAKLGQNSQSQALLLPFSRNFKPAKVDPYQHFYLYAYAHVLQTSAEGNHDDRKTILGKAIKLFQERSSRIEDPANRKCYGKDNYWNDKLISQARFFNLT